MNYERVNWENGTQVGGAYVEIDGTRYPVVMPTYRCVTPITAENLNIMDKAIDKGVNKEEIPFTIDGQLDVRVPLKIYKIGNIINISGLVQSINTGMLSAGTKIFFDKKYAPISGVRKFPCVQEYNNEISFVWCIYNDSNYEDFAGVLIPDEPYEDNFTNINITYLI